MSSYPIWLQAYQTYVEGGYDITVVTTADLVTTYTVTHIDGHTFATWAVSFGYPLDPYADTNIVRRIWANGRLLWSDAIGSQSGGMYGCTWTFYPGSETQPVDPLMNADHPGTTPAYRGQMIMVIDHFPLENFSNTIPGITAEIIDGALASMGGIYPPDPPVLPPVVIPPSSLGSTSSSRFGDPLPAPIALPPLDPAIDPGLTDPGTYDARMRMVLPLPPAPLTWLIQDWKQSDGGYGTCQRL